LQKEIAMKAPCRNQIDHGQHIRNGNRINCSGRHSARLIAVLLAMTGQVHAADLDLLIENVQTTEGRILVSLYRSAESFLQTAAYTRIVSADKRDGAGKVLVRFSEVTPGTYAAAVIHDRDGDGKLSTNLLGIPKEPYGFSSGARGRFGPPSFQDAAFSWPVLTGIPGASGAGAASPSGVPGVSAHSGAVTVKVE
jgi:uncharacterized protein (DUF2141 family)